MRFTPDFRAFAPGRINLIGEHTDYQGGFVFPAAIHLGIEASAAFADKTEVWSDRAFISFDANDVVAEGLPSWARYVAGMAIELREFGRLPNLKIELKSSLPAGAGLSSSAALEIVVGALWRLAADLPVSNAELALAGQRAENHHVGMKCGIMDQTASVFGKAGHALLIDTVSPGEPIPVPLPNHLAVVACDTRVKHALVGGEYNERRQQVESAAAKLGVKWLRDVEALDESNLTPLEAARARHVVGENKRVLAFRTALEQGDEAAMGALMMASHISLRDDFQVTAPEQDAMAEAAWDRAECVGARMTGGGFGGACVALVYAEKLDEFIAAMDKAYTERTGKTGSIFEVKPADGARAWRV